MEKILNNLNLFLDTPVSLTDAGLLLLVGLLLYMGVPIIRYRMSLRRQRRLIKKIDDRLILLRQLNQTDITKRN